MDIEVESFIQRAAKKLEQLRRAAQELQREMWDLLELRSEIQNDYYISIFPNRANKRFIRAWKNGILLSDELQDPGFMPLKMKKIEFEMQFRLNIEEMLSCYKNARDRHWSLSSLLEEYRFCRAESLLKKQQTDLPCAFEEYSRNHFTALPGSRLLASSVKKEKPMNTTGNRFSQLDNNESWTVLDIGLMEALDWRRGKMTSELHLSDRNMKKIETQYRAGKNRILLLDETQDPELLPLKMKKIEMQFWLNTEEMLSCNKNAVDRHWNLSSLLEEYRICRAESLLQMRLSDPSHAFEELSRYHFITLLGNKLLTSGSVKKENPMNTTGNRFSQLDNNESSVVLDIGLTEALDWPDKMTSKQHWFDTNLPYDPDFQHRYTFNQHKRKKIAQRVSSSVVSTIVFLGIFFDIWSQLSIIQVQPLHKEHGPLSIWLPFLGLLGFMAFVCAVATMILVRAPFTRMQKAMLIFWGILMHLQSAKSIRTALFVPLAGVLFMGWYAFGKSNYQMKGNY